MFVFFYIAAIAAANVLTAEVAPWLIHVDGQIVAITAGTWVIACTFWLRDLIQHEHGLRVVWAAIVAALALNFALSLHYDALLWITVASAAAFAVSESIDTIVYTRVGGRLGPRILASGAVSCPLDSAIFVIFGLSPLTTGIIGWNAVVLTIAVQAILKLALQLVAAVPTWRMDASSRHDRAPEPAQA